MTTAQNPENLPDILVTDHPDSEKDATSHDSVSFSKDTTILTQAEPTTLTKLRGLPWSIAGNTANTFFAQFTFFGAVFVLFLSTLGLSKSQIGLMLSLIPFTSVLAPILGVWVARFGYKRVFLTVFGARKLVTATLLLTPWVMATFGMQITIWFITAVVGCFAILRAVMEIALIPWIQEYVPNSVRGRYTATDNMFVTLAGIIAITIAGFAIRHTTGLTGYMALFGVGILFGFIALWAFSFVPGGAPLRDSTNHLRIGTALNDAIRDRDFRLYLTGVGLMTLATVPLASFLPLYLQEQIGLDSGQVVWIQIGALIGALISSYAWGWAADRYGSKPVMLSGSLILIALPLCWWLIPGNFVWTVYIALAVALIQGIANLGWVIGAGRLLYVTIVPPQKKVGYLALYSATIGIVSGMSQLAAGRLLDAMQHIHGHFFIFALHPYVPLILIASGLTAMSAVILRNIHAEATVSAGEFAGIFLRGNPFLAVGSLIRFQLAKDEHETVLVTERMGQSHSRLTVDEMLEALADPRFNVRYEAVITISRMRREPRLTQALIAILEGTELALSVNAAWALGRIGDRRAIEPLRRGLSSPYHSIRVHCARALGTLGDSASAPLFLERLNQETDKGLQMAYASALGTLRSADSANAILDVLAQMKNEGARRELALALARLVGKEHLFIRLVRQMRKDPGTTAAQAMAAFNKRISHYPKAGGSQNELKIAIDACIEILAQDDLANGAVRIGQIAQQLAPDNYRPVAQLILQRSAAGLQNYGVSRPEHMILAIHTMLYGWKH